MSAVTEFKPNIIGFLCNWCCYGGADLAGVSRYQFPPYIRVIRVMCSGRVDLSFVLRAFSNGTDGVFIGGCHLNDCHYNTHGNFDALSMTMLAKKLLEHVGINPDRLRIEWVSAGEGIRYADIMTDFAGQIEKLGPLGSSEGTDRKELQSRLEEVKKLVPYIKLVKKEKLASRLPNEADYLKLFTTEEVAALLGEAPAYYIDPDKCQACMICARNCPVEAIDGGKGQIHIIDQEKCIKCGTCLEVCPPRFGAVRKILAEPVPPPIPEEARAIARKGAEE
jgi:coenzyme F420-reducing hydrogenase delta subunit/NAD-dependent dihydropyrimidine dehydrogenase PreA subunit